MSKYTALEVRGYAAMFWNGNKDERIAAMMLHDYADILIGKKAPPQVSAVGREFGGANKALSGLPCADEGREAGPLPAAAAATGTRPEAALTWKQVPDVTQRQVAWIDRDARYVAVVSKGREYLLDLPPLPQNERIDTSSRPEGK